MMDTNSNLNTSLPQTYFNVEFKNIAAKNLLSATRETGEKLASLAGETGFAQILAQESEKHRKLQDLRQGPDRDNVRKAPIVY